MLAGWRALARNARVRLYTVIYRVYMGDGDGFGGALASENNGGGMLSQQQQRAREVYNAVCI